MSESFPIGQWWKEHPDEEFPPWCKGCLFIAPVCHGGEDGCSRYDNYADVCTVTRERRHIIMSVLDGRISCGGIENRDITKGNVKFTSSGPCPACNKEER